MAHKKKHSAPVPPGNQSDKAGPGGLPGQAQGPSQGEVASPQEQDPKRRLGDFEGTGEHALQQPSELNDGNQHSR